MAARRTPPNPFTADAEEAQRRAVRTAERRARRPPPAPTPTPGPEEDDLDALGAHRITDLFQQLGADARRTLIETAERFLAEERRDTPYTWLIEQLNNAHREIGAEPNRPRQQGRRRALARTLANQLSGRDTPAARREALRVAIDRELMAQSQSPARFDSLSDELRGLLAQGAPYASFYDLAEEEAQNARDAQEPEEEDQARVFARIRPYLDAIGQEHGPLPEGLVSPILGALVTELRLTRTRRYARAVPTDGVIEAVTTLLRDHGLTITAFTAQNVLSLVTLVLEPHLNVAGPVSMQANNSFFGQVMSGAANLREARTVRAPTTPTTPPVLNDRVVLTVRQGLDDLRARPLDAFETAAGIQRILLDATHAAEHEQGRSLSRVERQNLQATVRRQIETELAETVPTPAPRDRPHIIVDAQPLVMPLAPTPDAFRDACMAFLTRLVQRVGPLDLDAAANSIDTLWQMRRHGMTERLDEAGRQRLYHATTVAFRDRMGRIEGRNGMWQAQWIRDLVRETLDPGRPLDDLYADPLRRIRERQEQQAREREGRLADIHRWSRGTRLRHRHTGVIATIQSLRPLTLTARQPDGLVEEYLNQPTADWESVPSPTAHERIDTRVDPARSPASPVVPQTPVGAYALLNEE